MIIKINQVELKITWITFLYIFIVGFFLFYLTRDLSYNTAFVDEAIYATVGEEVLRKTFWESALSWMGGSYLYPVTSALINRCCGLSGIRFFAVICVLLTGIISGKIGKRLGGSKAEVITLGLFLFSAVTLNLAQLGTYDAPSLTFLALSFYLAIISVEKKNSQKFSLIILSSFLFCLGVLTKYVAVLFLPVLILIYYERDTLNFIKNSLIWLLIFHLIVGYYILNNTSYLYDLFTGSYFSEPASKFKIIMQATTDLNILIMGVLVALVYVIKKSDNKKISLVRRLIILGLIPICYHFFFSNYRSISKHMVFTSFFWAPVAGWILVKLANRSSSFYRKSAFINNISQVLFTVIIVAISTSLWSSFSNHWRFQRSWPSATNVLTYLTDNRKPTDRIFAEASAVYKYHTFSGFEDPYSWSSTWYLEHNNLIGTEAMKLAINDKQFKFIILNYYFTPDINRLLKPDIEKNYELAITDKYKISGVYDNVTEVWKVK